MKNMNPVVHIFFHSCAGNWSKDMLEEMNARLAAAREKCVCREMVAGQLTSLREARANLRERKSQLMKKRDAVCARHSRFAGFGFLRVWHAFRGSLDEQLQQWSKKVQEVEEALLKLEISEQEVFRRCEALALELEQIADAEGEYQGLLNEKADLLRRTAGAATERLRELDEQLGGCELCIKELDEVIAAGAPALEALLDVKKAFESAQSWGALDILGGGLLTTAAKHARIDEGRKAAEKAEILLKVFKAELSDVRDIRAGEIDLGGFAVFADFFFDGFIVDFYVQGKIADAKEKAATACEAVSKALSALSEKRDIEKERRVLLAGDLKAFVESV